MKEGVCQVHVGDEKMVAFNAFELDGILFEKKANC